VVTGDASPTETMGILEVDSIPSGAIVTVAGKTLGVGPKSARVTAGAKVKVKLELKGYQTLEEEVGIDAGKNIFRRNLQIAPASLHVESTPTDATLTANGQAVGNTPINVTLAAAKNVEFILTKQGYEPARWRSDVVAGEQYTWTKELKESAK